MNFILTIDTEADNQWMHGIPITTENIGYIPRFQNLFDRYQIKPTYLVTSEICDDKFAQDIFREYRSNGRAEIGAHLHSWTTPPYEEVEGLRYNDPTHPFANELNESLLDKKIENITRQIADSFGKAPTSFRSGRFGFNDNCAKLLAKHGYLVDSSVTPYVDWFRHKGLPGGKGGPNFIELPNNEYFINTDKGQLLEVPVTILPTKWPLTAIDSLTRLYCSWKESFPKKVVRKLFIGQQPLWLRPYTWTTIEMIEDLITQANRRSLHFITMMFHSSELMPGCSPYRKNELEVENLYSFLESFFALLNKLEINSITLSNSINIRNVQ
ncbi:MAG: polysaccharide deacetylase family protein [Bacteroidota bacterium]